MPEVRTIQQQVFEFTGGLNTDASLLTLPDNFTTDEANCSLDVNGTRRRRKGVGLETGGSYTSKSLSSPEGASTFFWRTPGGVASAAMLVAKVGSELHFFEAGATPSANKKSYTYDLESSSAAGATAATIAAAPVQFDSVAGRLVVTGKYIEPTTVTYEASGDSFSTIIHRIKVRDFEGVEDGLAVAERPSSLSDEHKYNLFNQGWTNALVSQYFTDKSKYPSNADISYRGKIDNPSTNVEEFNSDQLEAQAFGNALAPRGQYILNAFNTLLISGASATTIAVSSSSYDSGTKLTTINTATSHGLVVGQSVTIRGTIEYTDGEGETVSSSFEGITEVNTVVDADTFTIVGGDDGSGVTITYETISVESFQRPSGNVYSVRPEAVAGYAGRAWYAGVAHPNLESTLFFTQIVEREAQFSKCYQSNDPTSEHLPDALDSDGGVLIISDAGGIKSIKPYGNSLLVFAENGVWAISPGEKGYFSPTSYNIRKLHDVGCVSSGSVIRGDDALYYWGTDGIYTVAYNPESRQVEAVSLSLNRVNGEYANISSGSRTTVKSFYESSSQQAVWLYSSANNGRYDKALIFNRRLNAFIRFNFYDTSTMYNISAAAQTGRGSFDKNVKYLVYDSTNTRFSWFDTDRNTFTDFSEASDGGGESDAYMVVGLTASADVMFPKTASYVYVYFNKTETGFSDDGSGNLVLDNPSGCTMQSRWDWADNAESGKFGPGQQVYRFTRNYIPSGAGDTFADGRPVVFTKNKIRGRGRALQLKFTADEGKDMWLLGWSMMLDIAAGR